MAINRKLIREVTAPPTIDGIKKALFIQPHPDDNEIGAGGLMAKLVARGAEVWGLTVTDDRADCPAEGFKDGLSLRQREAIAAMESVGVKNAGFLGFLDKTDATAEEISEKIIPVIRKIRPDAVFSVDPTLKNECHRDHIKVGWAVRYAVMDAVCDFCPRLENGQRHSDVWQTSVLGQYFAGEPNTIADISDFWEKKLAAINCHESQVSPELLQALEFQARYFGGKARAKMGEAFTLYSFLQLHCYNLPIVGGNT